MSLPRGGFQDRPYQTEAVGSIWNYFYKDQGNPLIAMPTGTGKSVVIARFLQGVFAQYPRQRIMLLTHVKELIQQNYEKLMMIWPFAPAGIYSAGLGEKNANCPLTFAGIQSVWKKWHIFGHIDLILIDEAHLLSPNDQTMYRSFLAGLASVNPFLKVVGFTATPWRLGHGHLCDPSITSKGDEIPSLFTDVCFDITGTDAFNRLIAEGYLCPLIPRRPRVELAVDGLHLRGGEFIESEMQQRFDKDEITEAALREALEIAHNENRRHWLVFASGIEHADHIGSMLDYLGVSNGVVHSKREGRDKTIADFKRGEITADVNNNVLTTGFDSPHIDLIICLRATASSVLWVQMLGRGTRPDYAEGYNLDDIGGRLAAIQASEKQNCLVLDYARNTSRLGPINDPVVPRRKGTGGGDAPVKICDRCEVYNHASVRFCVNCGAEFVFEVKFKTEASTDDLIKGEMPITKVFDVDHISVDEHRKMGKPPGVKITYYYGYQSISEWINIEHTDWAGRKAVKVWNERAGTPLPTSTAEAINRIKELRMPTQIRVWTNRKPYPEIMAMCYDGSSFGTKDDAVPIVPEVEVRGISNSRVAPPTGVMTYDTEDDDIPF
jgi:DNA repair protein RadD